MNFSPMDICNADSGWWLSAVIGGLVTAMVLSVPARAQVPADCDGVNIKLAEQFANPVCYESRFRSSGANGRNQSIQGETRDYLIHFRSSRSSSGYTYLLALDFDKLMGVYGLAERGAVRSAKGDAGDGFDYVSVSGEGLNSCILFLKQSRPIRSGFRAQYFGIACDKRRDGEYSPAEAAALLELVEDY